MSDLVIDVRQLASYPLRGSSTGNEIVLLQEGGLGAPYASITTAELVATSLNSGPAMGVGAVPPANADGNQLFLGDLNFPPTAQILWDAYGVQGDGEVSWTGGQAASQGWAPGVGFNWATAPISPGNLQWFNLMLLDPAGSLHLPLGTLAVARDPAALNEVATLGWVGNNTVASFNGRIGRVQLSSADVYGALQLTSPIATTDYVNQSIFTAMTTGYPLVAYWNGRTGNVSLMLSDITCVFFQSGQIPISPTPPQGSNDYSIATTQWVTEAVQGAAAFLPITGGTITGSLTVDGTLTAEGTNALASLSNLSGITTGYSDTALTIGRNAGGAGYVNLVAGAQGLSVYVTNGSGVIATPYVTLTPASLTTTGIITVGAGAATVNSGTGAPTATRPPGSIYLRTDGAVGTHLYVSAGAGTWAAVAGV